MNLSILGVYIYDFWLLLIIICDLIFINNLVVLLSSFNLYFFRWCICSLIVEFCCKSFSFLYIFLFYMKINWSFWSLWNLILSLFLILRFLFTFTILIFSFFILVFLWLAFLYLLFFIRQLQKEFFFLFNLFMLTNLIFNWREYWNRFLNFNDLRFHALLLLIYWFRD